VTSLDRWNVTLASGARLAIWADGFSQVDDDYVFSVLIDREPEEPGLAQVEIAARTPGNPNRVDVVTARIPRSEVVQVHSGS
jgi:hypothetical protein